LLWPLILITIGIGLLAMELFVPSAGALGVFAGIAFLAAVVVGFMEDFYIGTSMMVTVAVIVPVFFGIFAHLYPKRRSANRCCWRGRTNRSGAMTRRNCCAR
jgi:membrane-bound ClpP family serine protease